MYETIFESEWTRFGGLHSPGQSVWEAASFWLASPGSSIEEYALSS